MPKFTGEWQGGRSYRTRDGRTVFVIERMRHGRRYTIPLEAGNEREALAELALFERDPGAYDTRRAERAAQAIHTEPGNVQRFLDHLKQTGRTERYRKNCWSYLAQ